MNLIKVNRSEELSSQNEKFFAQTSSSNPSSPVSASNDDIFGDPILSPSVGDDYQVEIPSVLVDSQNLHASELPCITGLSIPIMWVHTDDAKRELKDYCTSLGSRCLSDDFIHSHLPSSCSVLKAEKMQINEYNGCSPLPESRVSLWSEEEIQSFLLGLYIFRKNLVQVRKFIGCKDMKDVLSFYYGDFYRSEAYHRWADCRKSRSRKCIQGQRIFTGWRQQELLSRLLMGMPKEEQASLIKRLR